MKKKVSLINLNNQELKNDQVKQQLDQELCKIKGGVNCMIMRCTCSGGGTDYVSNDSTLNDAIRDSW